MGATSFCLSLNVEKQNRELKNRPCLSLSITPSVFSSLPGGRQLGDHRGPENRPEQRPEARQARGLHAEEEEVAPEGLAQGEAPRRKRNKARASSFLSPSSASTPVISSESNTFSTLYTSYYHHL